MNKFTPLPRSFYEPSARVVARALLGHWLLRDTPDPEGPVGGCIVETEAYLKNDPACHGARGETARNRVMFGRPGHAYVYLIYGFHFCVNAVCRPLGIAEAVLIRAVTVELGEDFMRARRPVTKPRNLTDGPGKLCQAMDITRKMDGADLCDAASPLFIAENPEARKFRKEQGPLIVTTRIGITQAAEMPLRFCLQKSPFLSRPARR